MLRVLVRFDKRDEPKTIKLEGHAEQYPELNKDFFVYVMVQTNKIEIDLGRVFNIKTYNDMLLVQTDQVVAEVWLLGGECEKLAEVLSFIADRNTLFFKGNKISGLRRQGACVRSASLSRFNKLLKALKEDAAFHKTPWPPLRLANGEEPC